MASWTRIIPHGLLRVIKGGAETINKRMEETEAYISS